MDKSKIPTKEGWYWWIEYLHDQWKAVQVKEYEGELCVFIMGRYGWRYGPVSKHGIWGKKITHKEILKMKNELVLEMKDFKVEKI